ncbi:hypothetical protein ACC785_39125, partial [Rhizobium ruizarguesonis]
LNAAADILEARTSELVAAMTGETVATAQWAAINCGLGSDILREAAAMTTQISGDYRIVCCGNGGKALATDGGIHHY